MTDDSRRTIRFTLNGRPVTANVAVYDTIVDVLQRDFALFGARESCAQGLCGCCTVVVNGDAVSGCLYLAAFVDSADVATIEGLGADGVLHPIQQAYLSCGGFQCGFCTPGFVLMTKELLERQPQPTEDQIRHHLSGNLCRCASYPEIVDAVKVAAGQRTRPLDTSGRG